jgi:hypothetical protein
MISLTAPAIAWLAYPTIKAQRTTLLSPGVLARALGLFFVPFLGFYALILVAARRDPFSSWGDVHDLHSLLHLATRQDFGGISSPNLGNTAITNSALFDAYVDGLTRHFGVALLLVAGLGTYSLLREPGPRRRLGIGLVLALFASGPLFAMANVLPIDGEHGLAFADRFATMSHVPLAALIGAGLAAILARAMVIFPSGPMSHVVRALVALVFVWPLALNATDVDQRDNRRGIEVAHDLFRRTPDGALVLVSGDAFNGATLWTCGVEKACGERIAFSPGQLHMPWRVEQLRRRRPDLVLPAPTGKFLTTRELVEANLPLRPVHVMPGLLDAEPALRDAFDFVPEGMLVRAMPLGSDLVAQRGSVLASARALLDGQGCDGCIDPGMRRPKLVTPSLEVPLTAFYALAFENHARFARALYHEEGLALALEARADEIDAAWIRTIRGQ